MAIYLAELKTQMASSGEIASRFPSIQELKDALDGYRIHGQGIVVNHSSLFDYRYDTESSDYHKVESAGTIGIMQSSIIIDDKIYLVIDFNENFDPEKNHILYYRATVQTNPQSQDHKLHFSNLFAIDLITVLDKEMTDTIQLSTIELYEDEWWSQFNEESHTEEIEA